MYVFIDHALKTLKNLCFPITCCCCKNFVETEGLCPECWKKIKWISNPKCKICGIPFEIDVEAICPFCLKKKPYFDRAVSVFNYDNFSKRLILKFKYEDVTYISKKLANWMYRVSENDIKNADIIVPVPIHFIKRLKRKYNQSELLAMELEKLSNIIYEPRILKKIKRTNQQEGLSREKRLKNVKGSFGIDQNYAEILHSKTVVLVDDVLTTGATVNECAKVLKQAGATKVIV
ncbi:MAG: ComF family protein, partial [Holosporaceae bacterium]|nr:ComF family protein [Holosporaceae bacterium]